MWQLEAFYGCFRFDRRNEIGLLSAQLLSYLFSYDITHKLMDTIMKKIPEHVASDELSYGIMIANQENVYDS